ncbi:MAG: thioredoxin fold domain-containing protein [Gammaproteobacteria bacterium]|nr:thioredoxin fold domain-containing protein [Gammaproteobacteria bacterium]
MLCFDKILFRLKTVFLYLVMLSSLLPVVTVANQASTIREIKDLGLEARLSEGKQLIIILFSASSCEYCELIRQSYLLPLQQNSKYKDKIRIGQVEKEDYYYLYDFNGESIGGDTLALRYDIDLVPTIIFIDHKGRELAKRIVGITLIDYLDMYIDQAIQSSINKI